MSAPIVAIDARDAFAPELRGWGRYELELVRALRNGAGEGLELLVLEQGGAGPELLFEQVKLPWTLLRTRATMVHALNCWLPLVRPCPGVVTIQDLAFEDWPGDFHPVTGRKYRTIVPLAARSAQRIICPSEFTRDDVCARYGVDPARVRVIPLAPALDPGGLDPPPGPYLLGVGDLRAKKNFAALVRAYAALRRDPGIPHRLVLAGVDAGSGPELRRLAGEHPLELTGYVSDARLDALIRGAEVLVHPSLYEGFGLVLLEAMARGTPVVAARATALPETGGDAALYFDGGAEDLRAVLAALLADADERESLASRGRERASRFSWERTARETAAVYRELSRG
ncbi:MAG TPA: glycosyltransferase family 1 protein [Solirubrobacteraceae bacterium]|nr:glycosyltransferase family 1 protein [Solirubrobacteraceae bacterium]